MDDLISRQEAIDAINEQIEQCDKALSSFDITMKDEYAVKVERASLVAYKEQLEALPSAQPETHDKRMETHACDCISRKAAIDALDKRFDSIPMEQTTEILLLRKDLRELPSAQPEKRTEERTETHACDYINRQAAIDEIEERKSANGYRNVAVISELNRLEGYIMRLPSAQPEIIRCKDCKYNSNTCGNYVNCDIIPQMFGRTTDNFCSRAERRTDEQDSE